MTLCSIDDAKLVRQVPVQDVPDSESARSAQIDLLNALDRYVEPIGEAVVSIVVKAGEPLRELQAGARIDGYQLLPKRVELVDPREREAWPEGFGSLRHRSWLLYAAIQQTDRRLKHWRHHAVKEHPCEDEAHQRAAAGE